MTSAESPVMDVCDTVLRKEQTGLSAWRDDLVRAIELGAPICARLPGAGDFDKMRVVKQLGKNKR